MGYTKIYNYCDSLCSHRHFRKYEKYVSLILWLGVIFYLSANSLQVFDNPSIWEFILRKLFHMFEFGLLVYLIFRILGQTEKRHIFWNLGWSLIFTVLYAIFDEYHQTSTFGRVGTYRDVLIDTSGIVISTWLIYLNYHHKKLLRLASKKP